MSIADIHKLFMQSKGVCTDTRSLKEGQLFFALKGDNFNGNKYAAQALQSGASYAVIDEEEFVVSPQYILVKDVLNCLQELAAFHRDYLNIPIIAITGSNGKTTTKELLHVVLQKKFNTFATKGNLNNHIGVPLSLLSINQGHEMAIIEMGANHQKEIASYCVWATPNYGLITNIGKAHLEGFGGIQGIIKGKTELYDAIEAKKGLIFYNSDDEIIAEQSKKVSRKFSYGQKQSADLVYELSLKNANVVVSVGEEVIESNLVGMYNGHNIAAALAIGAYFEVPLAKMKAGLEAYHSDNNRSQIVAQGGNKFILDAYNANPTSMLAALENFSQYQTEKKGVVLGDMFEVGETSSAEHKVIVDYLRTANFDFCVLVGDFFYEHLNEDFNFFKTTSAAKAWFLDQKFKDHNILIKGSRAMRMEEIIKD